MGTNTFQATLLFSLRAPLSLVFDSKMQLLMAKTQQLKPTGNKNNSVTLLPLWFEILKGGESLTHYMQMSSQCVTSSSWFAYCKPNNQNLFWSSQKTSVQFLSAQTNQCFVNILARKTSQLHCNIISAYINTLSCDYSKIKSKSSSALITETM